MRLAVGALAIALLVSTAAQAQTSSERPARPAVTPSTSFTIGGAVEHPRALALADLQKAPATTQSVFYVTGRGQVTGRFTGVLLWTLLSEAGVKPASDAKNAVLRRSILVTATDGYAVTLSIGELDPSYGSAQALIAYAQDDKPLGDSGFARLIMPQDKDGGRNVMRIATIEVR